MLLTGFQTVNKVGRVVKVIKDQEGDLRVDFKGQQYAYTPACCLPAAGAALDTLSGKQRRSSDDSTLGEKYEDINRKIDR